MNLTPLALAPPALLLVAAAFPQDDEPKVTRELVAEAGKLFQRKCSSCHDQPDLDFAVDRAWLGQVHDTA